MKIGIDLDGVVIDSVTLFNTYEEIYDIDVLKGNNLVSKKYVNFQDKYDWTEEEKKNFANLYLPSIAEENRLMPGFKVVYNMLRKEGHKFVVITSRGNPVNVMKGAAKKLLKDENIEFDKCYWGIHDKVEVCKKEKIDLMIEDTYEIVKELTKEKIKVLYFRDVNMFKIRNNPYVTEVNNWGDIYRYFSTIKDKK